MEHLLLFDVVRAARQIATVSAVFSALAVSSAFAADAKCQLKALATLPMHPLPSGLVTLPMTLNGRPSELMFDSAGGIRALMPEVVEELKLPRTQGDIVIYNVKGAEARDQVRVQAVNFAGTTVPMTFAVLAGRSRAEKKAGDENAEGALPRINAGDNAYAFDGIFTPDVFFQNADVELDFAGQRFTLFSPDHCKGQVVHWPAAAVAAVPFRLESNMITFDVELDGLKTRAIMDTGASMNTLDQQLAITKFDFDPNAAGVEKVAELLPGKYVYERRFKTLSLEGITIKNPMVTIMPDATPKEAETGSHIHSSIVESPPMLLGMPILGKLHIYIAFRERMLYITPGGTPPKPEASATQAPAPDAPK